MRSIYTIGLLTLLGLASSCDDAHSAYFYGYNKSSQSRKIARDNNYDVEKEAEWIFGIIDNLSQADEEFKIKMEKQKKNESINYIAEMALSEFHLKYKNVGKIEQFDVLKKFIYFIKSKAQKALKTGDKYYILHHYLSPLKEHMDKNRSYEPKISHAIKEDTDLILEDIKKLEEKDDSFKKRMNHKDMIEKNHQIKEKIQIALSKFYKYDNEIEFYKSITIKKNKDKSITIKKNKHKFLIQFIKFIEGMASKHIDRHSNSIYLRSQDKSTFYTDLSHYFLPLKIHINNSSSSRKQ